MILIPIGEIYAQIAKSATSYYPLILLPLTNFTLHPLTCVELSSLFKRRTVTTDMHFCYIVYILYSGSQSYIAASFSTVRGYETRRKVFGDPFNG